jgi:hypothetical protein
MEQQGEKKRWVAPELLVLVRSHPEEAVLAACKFLLGSVGPVHLFDTCATTTTILCDTTCLTSGPS